jgi:hypothetical protein
MRKEEKALNIIGLISTRKTELYQNLINEIPEDKELEQEEKKELAEKISETDNSVFLTEEEVQSEEINPENTIDDVDLNLKAFIQQLGFADHFELEERLEYPDISISSNLVIDHLREIEDPNIAKLEEKMEEDRRLSVESLDDILEELDRHNFDIVEEIE